VIVVERKPVKLMKKLKWSMRKQLFDKVIWKNEVNLARILI